MSSRKGTPARVPGKHDLEAMSESRYQLRLFLRLSTCHPDCRTRRIDLFGQGEIT